MAHAFNIIVFFFKQQIGLTVLSVLMIGAGRLNSALSLLSSASVHAPMVNVLHYNFTLLKVKIALRSSSQLSDLSHQTLLNLQGHVQSNTV